jgi:lipopolysaccharide export system permease protein
MKFLTKLDKYILSKFLATFIFFVLMMSVIICVIDYTQKIDDFVKNNAPTGELLVYFLVTAPSFIVLLFPLFVFLATIYYTSRLAYRTEIIAILASGVSYWRFLRPFIIGGALLCTLNFFTNHYWIPRANVVMNDFLRKYFFDKKISADGVHLKISDSTFIYFGNFNFSSSSGSEFTIETFDGIVMKEKLIASRVSYNRDSATWKLMDVVKLNNDSIRETLTKKPEQIEKYNFTPEDLNIDRNIKQELTTPALQAFIDREKSRGAESVSDFEIELYKRTAQPFAAFILVIIGVCIASRKVRGGSGLHLAIGIAISALYVLTMQLTATFTTNAGLHPMLAVWIPNIVFLILAIYLYRKQAQ